jgi:hypothetical protein
MPTLAWAGRGKDHSHHTDDVRHGLGVELHGDLPQDLVLQGQQLPREAADLADLLL